MAFVAVQQWEADSRWHSCARTSPRREWPSWHIFHSRRYQRIASISVTILLHAIAAYFIGTRLAVVPQDVTQKSLQTIAVFAVENENIESPKQETQKATSDVDLEVVLPKPPSEWAVQQIRMALPAETQTKSIVPAYKGPVSQSAFDPYAGASPLRVESVPGKARIDPAIVKKWSAQIRSRVNTAEKGMFVRIWVDGSGVVSDVSFLSDLLSERDKDIVREMLLGKFAGKFVGPVTADLPDLLG